MGSLTGVAGNILVAFFIIDLAGAALLFIEIRNISGLSLGEAAWQSIFLSASALNSAGFSILPHAPDGNNAATLGAHPYLMWVITPLIIVGALGWPYIMDLRRNRTRFSLRQWRGQFKFKLSRLTLDTRTDRDWMTSGAFDICCMSDSIESGVMPPALYLRSSG